jgi:hypothetical protein
MRLHLKDLWAVPIVALGFTSGVHASGTMDTPPRDVSITTVSGAHMSASGAVHAARVFPYGQSLTKEIGCQVTVYERIPGIQDRSLNVQCFANAAIGATSATLACSKVGDPGAIDSHTGMPDPAGAEIAPMAAAVQSITIDSFVSFDAASCPPGQTDPVTHLPCGECMWINVSNSSTHWQVPHD